mmetsp:Transcript_40401/g.77527  ORF Transcript_40401/g.77527 Transcript_40401/m.77527 type:complete len:83 (-) Transcript_40401:491-739(-)
MYCPVPENWPTAHRSAAEGGLDVEFDRCEDVLVGEARRDDEPAYGSPPSVAGRVNTRVAASKSETTARASKPAETRRDLWGA